jgi:LytS/YehU family sensor histidine kinase
VALADELGFLERYLAIEQVRFSDRLRVRFDVDEPLRDAAVPAFILQPLVENALRHGIAQRADGGNVEISAKRDGDVLLLSVTDNGPGVTKAPRGARTDGNGLGLANTRERLTTLYGPSASLELHASVWRGTVALVRLPYRVAPRRAVVPSADSSLSP